VGGTPNLIRNNDTGFLVEASDIDGFTTCPKKLMDVKFREAMGVCVRAEAEKWDWEAATLVLRNVQYKEGVHQLSLACIWRVWRSKNNERVATVEDWSYSRMRIKIAVGYMLR